MNINLHCFYIYKYDQFYRIGPGAENKRVFNLNVQLSFYG